MIRSLSIGALALTLCGCMGYQDTKTVENPHAGHKDAPPKLVIQAAPKGAKAYFISPKDGDTVGRTFTVRFGLKGMGIAPAGFNVPETGHHHLIIDDKKLPQAGVPMPPTDNLKHFGKGQSETQLTLPPGKHTLRLVLGDWLHVMHDPPVASELITITVK